MEGEAGGLLVSQMPVCLFWGEMLGGVGGQELPLPSIHSRKIPVSPRFLVFKHTYMQFSHRL